MLWQRLHGSLKAGLVALVVLSWFVELHLRDVHVALGVFSGVELLFPQVHL